MRASLAFATLIELVKETIKYDKKLGITSNGDNNDYPERVERLINNSSSATPAAKLMRQYIMGRGVAAFNDIKVNSKGETFFQFLKSFVRSLVRQGGVFVHVKYNIKGEPVYFKVLPYAHCRIGDVDDTDWVGKILVCDKWNDIRLKKKDITVIDAYNSKVEIVQKQMTTAGGVKKYKGQVYFYNPSEYKYPMAPIQQALNDADSEFRSSVFKNKSLRKGFFGKQIIVTPPMIDEHYRTTPKSKLDDDGLEVLREQEQNRDSIRKSLAGFIGAENNEGFLHMEMEFEGDDIKKAFQSVKIESDINDKLFEYTEKSAANNIRKAYNNVPSILIETNESSVFGQSGALLNGAKLFYQEQTEEERMSVMIELKRLFTSFRAIQLPKDAKIELLIKTELNKDENEQDDNNIGNNTPT